MRCRSGLASTLLLGAALGAAAPSPGASAEDGAALFRGTGLSAQLLSMSGVALRGSTSGCGRCHGEDGRGRVDGGVPAPPIRWRILAAPTAARPGYDAQALRLALENGVDPAGRRLHPFMPRYALSAAQAAALADYLGEGMEQGHPAVSEAEIRLLVPHVPGDEAIPLLIDALWAEPSRQAWGRRLRAVGLQVRPGEARRALAGAGPVLAAVAGPGQRVAELDATLEQAGLSHLFPVDSYAEARPGVVLAEAPLSVQLELLRRHGAEKAGTISVLCGNVVRLDHCTSAPSADARTVLATGPWARVRTPEEVPASVTTIYVTLDEAGALLALTTGRKFDLVIADPRGRAVPSATLAELQRFAPSLLAGRPEVARRAHAAADLAAFSLRKAGPWPTSASLVEAAGALQPREAAALAAPWREGTRADGRYGVQLLRIPAHAAAAAIEAQWIRP